LERLTHQGGGLWRLLLLVAGTKVIPDRLAPCACTRRRFPSGAGSVALVTVMTSALQLISELTRSSVTRCG
jgi:hypothetical protein